MAFCERLSEQLAVVAVITPQAGATAGHTSNVVAMAMHRRALFIVQRGAGVAGGCLVEIEEANAAFTAGTAVILTRAATACAAADSQYLFEVSGEAMAAGNTALRAVVTPAVAGDLIALVALADVERYHPASDRDLATVVAIQAAN